MEDKGGSRKRKRARVRRRREKCDEHKQVQPSHRKKTTREVREEDEREQHPKSSASASAKTKKFAGLNKASNFLEKMKARLSGGHFRMLKVKLYTCTGKEALDYLKEDPALFDMCHAGYQEQMSHWPKLPVNLIIKWLKDHDPSLVVADFGCGDARLAKNVKNKVFSFDLVSHVPSVIDCDMSNTPFDSKSVDVDVFCLSLMGTYFPKYLQEILWFIDSGWLLIAEVKSRFDPNTAGADPKKFIIAVCDLGFSSITKDFSNKMFILLYFKKKEVKDLKRKKDVEWPELKPCLYKRR